MHSALKISWIAFAVINIWVHAAARDIHVSHSAPDGGDGARERPLRTLDSALRVAEPGDVVCLAEGVYREGNLRFYRGGTSEKRLTVQANADAKVVITGSTVVTGWRQSDNGAWRRESWDTDSQQLFCDGEPLKQIGAANSFTTLDGGDGNPCLKPTGSSVDDLTSGSFSYDSASKKLFCRLRDDADPNQYLMEASVEPGILDGGDSSFITLRGITFQHSNGTASGQRAALVRISGSGWLVEDCTFAAGDFAGVAVSGDGHVFRNVRVIGNGCVGIDVNGSDARHNNERYADRELQNLLFDSLYISENNYRGFYQYWHSGGMKLVPGVRGVTVRNCTVVNNHGPGIWFDAALGSNRVEDNLVADNDVGIIYEIGYPAADDEMGILIRNNRVARNRNQGVYISASDHAEIRNNTFYMNVWDVVLHGMPRGDGTLKHNVVSNNIFMGRDADAILYVGENARDNVLEGNVYARGNGKLRVGCVTGNGYDARYHKLRSLRSDFSEFEKNGVSESVEWNNPEELDFTLRSPENWIGKGWEPRE